MSEEFVALYARVSTENQELEAQKEKLVEYAEREGWEWELFAEKVSSIAERPELDAIMDRLGEFDKVVVSKIDRFARSIIDFNERMSRLEGAGVDFEAVDQPVNTSDEVYGDFLLKQLALFAELERKMIRKRMQEGFEKAMKEGRVGRPEKLSDEEKEELAGLYSRGWSWKSLMDKYDCGRSTVHRALKEKEVLEDG